MAENHNALPSSEEINTPHNEKNDKLANPLETAHERFGIDLNAPEIARRTIEKNGFTVLELEEPHTLPTLEEWVAERLAQGYAGYNYGCFVMNEAEQVGFAKVHYGPKNIQSLKDDGGKVIEFEVGGVEREMEVLEALDAKNYIVPQVLGYNQASAEDAAPEDKVYEMLVIEAILPDFGSVRGRQEWTAQLSRVAAQKIKTFAKPINEVPLFQNESIALPVEKLIDILPHTNDDYDEALTWVLSDYSHLDTPIVVHGDTWFNNIIARNDDSDALFVDWELAGAGYQGQDAGRKLWDLTLTSETDWSLADYSEAAGAFADEWCQTDEDMTNLKFGVMYESLRWITERIRDIEKPQTSPEDRAKYEAEIPEIKAHALMILEEIQKNAGNQQYGQSV